MPDITLILDYLCARCGIDPTDERGMTTTEVAVITFLLVGAAIGYASLSEYRQKEAYASTAELSVYISPDFRRKGAGSALIGAVLDRAKECGTLHSVVSVITAGNEVSEKLHQKFGFAFCGTLHQVGFKHGKYHDIDNFELIFDGQK